jgi:hypothetical protein
MPDSRPPFPRRAVAPRRAAPARDLFDARRRLIDEHADAAARLFPIPISPARSGAM